MTVLCEGFPLSVCLFVYPLGFVSHLAHTIIIIIIIIVIM